MEPCFHPDSYGYRPGKSALDAVGVTRQRCWRYDRIHLVGGAPPSNPEGADHDDLQDCRSTSVAPSLHLHSSVDDGAGPLQPGEHRAPVQSGEQGTVSRLELGSESGSSTGISASPVHELASDDAVVDETMNGRRCDVGELLTVLYGARGVSSKRRKCRTAQNRMSVLRHPDHMILAVPNGVAAAPVRFHPATLRANPPRSHAA